MSADELSPIVSFARLYNDRADLAAKAEQVPLLQDILADSIVVIDTRAAELANANGEVKDHYRSIGRGAVADQAQVEEAVSILERLGLTDQVEQVRAEIAAKANSPELPIAKYLLRLIGEATATDDETVTATPIIAAASPAAAENAEKSKPKVTIVVDPNNNISINGRRPVALSRELHHARSQRPEAEGRAFRVEMMQLLATHPDETFNAKQIWSALRSGPVDREFWRLYGRSFFLENIVTFNRKPLFVAHRDSEKGPYTYKLGDFDVTIETTLRSLKVMDNVYTLPNGREVGGRAGRVLHLLSQASKDKPLRTEQVLELYTPEEQAKLEVRDLLSGLVASARESLRANGSQLVPHKVMIDDGIKAEGRRYSGYYLVPAESLKAADTSSQPDASPKPTPEVAATPEVDLDEPLSLHEATVLAAFLNFHKDALAQYGMYDTTTDELEGIYEALNRKVIETYSNGEKSSAELSEIRSRSFAKITALLADEQRLHTAIEHITSEDRNDPRYDLLIHLSYADAGQIAFTKELLRSHPEVTVVFDAGRRRGFVIVDTLIQKAVTPDGHDLLSSWYGGTKEE